MQLHTAVPDGIRRRYGVKVVGWCLLAAIAILGAEAALAAQLLAGADGGTVSTDAVLTALVGTGVAVVGVLFLLSLVLGIGTGRSLAALADGVELVAAQIDRDDDGDAPADGSAAGSADDGTPADGSAAGSADDGDAPAAGDADADGTDGDTGEDDPLADDAFETGRIDDLGRAFEALADLEEATAARIEELEAERGRVEAARRSLEVDNDELLAEAERFGEVMDACADGDLTRRLDVRTDHEALARVAGSFNRMLSELERTVVQVQRFTSLVDEASTDLQESAKEIGAASESVSRTVQEISEGSSRQTDDLQAAAGEVRELSATIEEVAATTGTIAQEAERVAGLADDGVATAGQAADEMREAGAHTARVADTIDALNEDAERIAESIALIDDIAQQTNMLALNAAIETARTDQDRAGNDGGFDVVADEVQELSAEIQEAVDEIQGTIDALQARASESADGIGTVEERIVNATESVDDLDAELSTVSDRVEHVSNSVQEIDNVSNDQATTVEALAGLVENVARVSAETSEEADRVADASRAAAREISDVSAKARSLDSQADRLADVVEEFEVSTRQQLDAGAAAEPAPSAPDDGNGE
jgi:methyl-accepting chemotaxis protein